RDHIGAHEAGRLQAPQAGAGERIDQLHLALGWDRLGLVLTAVAGDDLPYADLAPRRRRSLRATVRARRTAHRIAGDLPVTASVSRSSRIGTSLYSAAVAPSPSDPVAVIGASGALGFGLAIRLARTGVPVAIGSREAKRAQETAERARSTIAAARTTIAAGEFSAHDNAGAAA